MVETKHLLKDPCQDRKVPEVPLPPALPLEIEEVYLNGKPEVKKVREHFNLEGALSKELAAKITQDVTAVMKAEANLVRMVQPVVIVGDIHGQYFDLIHMFEKVID
jgi:serine/threonine-protein phosphatase 2B catalytic subunit